jgi:FkbM family methyltransferase
MGHFVSYAQNFEDVMLWRALGDAGPGFYIDVGANDPVIDSVTRAFYDRGWRGVNVEPLPECQAALARDRPEDINLQCAAGAAEGELELWTPEICGWASLAPEVIARRQRAGHQGVLRRVRVTTLAEICRQHVHGEIHFLKIDVEGGERAVIEGMDNVRFRPWIIVVEATEPDSGVENHQQWEPLLLARAYGLAYADGLNRFYVAREHDGLRERLRHPPNVFDHFVRYAQEKATADAREAGARAEAAASRAREADLRAAEAGARAEAAASRAREAAEEARHARAEAGRWQAQLRLVHASTSWRVTRPLRVLKRLSRGDFSPVRLVASRARQRARAGMDAALRRLLRHPSLRRVLGRVVRVSPWLHQRLLRLAGRLDAIAAGAPDLSPWAVRIHRALAAAARAETAPDAPVPASPAPARLRLACVSPLPPEPTGISAYSAELLPALCQWYEIEVIVAQPGVADDWIRGHCPVRTVEWFRAHAARFDRVLYHFGNSPFHQHMFALLDEIPGVVMLHDFFLSSAQAHRALFGAAHAWERALHASHGYRALASGIPLDEAIARHPVNLPVLQAARGVIVHSEYARRLAARWYGGDAGRDWTVLPHLRAPVPARPGARAEARKALGIAADAFLVCAFGILGQTKLNDRLVDAWLASPLAEDARALLVFVGENDHGDYGRGIARRIRRGAGRVRITGWVGTDVFRRYLAAADVGVQLRARSRGETSGTVLDCMNHGLATIVNAHGSLADLDAEGLWMLPDAFDDRELADALLALRRDAGRRERLGTAARAVIAARHAPAACARQYADAIERVAAAPGWTASLPKAREAGDLAALAVTLAREFPPVPRRRQLLVDVSAMAQVDLRTGIQRVVRAVLGEWLAYDESWQVEPVRAAPEGYRYARRFACDFLGIAGDWAEDAPVDAWAGDVFFGLDFHNSAVPAREALLRRWRDDGVRVGFLVYDLLPVTHPEFFPEGNAEQHRRWLETIRAFDFAACISRATADALRAWLAASGGHSPRVDAYHNGADVDASLPTRGFPPGAEETLRALRARPSFLMVGTIEPRKGYADALAAFERLWARGVDANLVIVGKEGWKVSGLVRQIRRRAAEEGRLFWLEGISDEYLESVYAASTCLVAASHAEGFGLPLIEAARHGIPVIARDIPVFREVAGAHAHYFDDDLADALAQWLELYRRGAHPRPDGMAWRTWKESARQLWELVTAEADTCSGPRP